MTKDETIVELFRAQLGSEWKVQPISLSPDRASRIVRFNQVGSPPNSFHHVLICPELFEKAVRDGKLPFQTLQDIEDAVHMRGGPIGH